MFSEVDLIVKKIVAVINLYQCSNKPLYPMLNVNFMSIFNKVEKKFLNGYVDVLTFFFQYIIFL